jgi:hypothetical protein
MSVIAVLVDQSQQNGFQGRQTPAASTNPFSLLDLYPKGDPN